MIKKILRDFVKNLLPKKIFRRVALNYKFSKIKPRFHFPVSRLPKFWPKFTVVALSLIYLSGYYPQYSFPPVTLSTVYAQQDQQTDEVIAQQFPFPVILPHLGYLSTKFSLFHPGIDIATDLGTLVHPIAEGEVEEVSIGFWGYGNHVMISHSNNFKSLYAHLGKVFIKKGQRVTSEDTLGEVGLTGFTSGPHTHLEISYLGKKIDPLTILPNIYAMAKPARK